MTICVHWYPVPRIEFFGNEYYQLKIKWLSIYFELVILVSKKNYAWKPSVYTSSALFADL